MYQKFFFINEKFIWKKIVIINILLTFSIHAL